MQGNDWFTVEPIDADTFAISEYRHWEEPHCYLICGQRYAALIDTGLGVSNLKSVVDALTTLPVVVLTTHVHWDHIGGHRHFSYIAVHGLEQNWLTSFPLPLSVVKQNLLAHPCAFPHEFEVDKYQLFHGTPQMILHDEDTIDLGNRTLRVIHTPGHSPGHCCFYESERGYLFAGDLIYRGCLDAFYPTTDPIEYLNSVSKVCRLDIQQILPGHHQLQLPTSLVYHIHQAFTQLNKLGQLRHGSGIFDFGLFGIHL